MAGMPEPTLEPVVDELREQILSGRLRSGTRLTQRALAEVLGVSRLPIRDALRRLEVEGLVSLEGQGAVVSPMSIDDLGELFELRGALEPLACRLAVHNIGTAQVLLFRQLLQRMRDVDDMLEWHVAHSEFHSALYRPCRRGRMIEILDILRQQSERYVRIHLAEPSMAEWVDEQHEALVQALADRDAQRVEELVASHLEATHQRVALVLLTQEESVRRAVG
jgi:DNA-binding GntR family transcriptional regulator